MISLPSVMQDQTYENCKGETFNSNKVLLATKKTVPGLVVLS